MVKEVEDDGRALLGRLIDRGFEVTAAGWVQTDHDGRPYLYIASPRAGGGTVRSAYAVIDEALASLQPSHVGLFTIKLVPTNHPVARALDQNIHRSAGTPLDTTVYAEAFYGVDVQRPVFIYALPAPTPA